MPRSAKDGRVLDCGVRLCSEDEPEPEPGVSGGRPSLDPQLEPADRPPRASPGPGLCWSVGLSLLGSAAAMAAAGCFCALTYPLLKDLRAATVRGHDGTEQRILGFWSILLLSVSVGCVCFVFSWALTSIDSQERSGGLVPSLRQDKCRGASVHDSCLGHGVAVLNGIFGFLTAIWSLS